MKLKAMNISLVFLCYGTVCQFRAQLTFLVDKNILLAFDINMITLLAKNAKGFEDIV